MISLDQFISLFLKDHARVKQIRNVICVVLRDSDGALTGREVHELLQESGYSGTLEATNRALYRMSLDGRVLSVGVGEKHYVLK